MSFSALKELLLELFHNLSLGSLYHQDPELRPIPINDPVQDRYRRH